MLVENRCVFSLLRMDLRKLVYPGKRFCGNSFVYFHKMRTLAGEYSIKARPRLSDEEADSQQGRGLDVLYRE